MIGAARCGLDIAALRALIDPTLDRGDLGGGKTIAFRRHNAAFGVAAGDQLDE